MEEIIITSSMLTLAFAVVAIIGVLMVLRVFDWLTGTPFNNIREVIQSEAKASALYYGLRFLGVCLLVGQLFS